MTLILDHPVATPLVFVGLCFAVAFVALLGWPFGGSR